MQCILSVAHLPGLTVFYHVSGYSGSSCLHVPVCSLHDTVWLVVAWHVPGADSGNHGSLAFWHFVLCLPHTHTPLPKPVPLYYL